MVRSKVRTRARCQRGLRTTQARMNEQGSQDLKPTTTDKRDIHILKACGMSSERLARITPFLASYLEKRRIPGYALLLARRDEVVFRSEQGVKDWDTQEAITPSD